MGGPAGATSKLKGLREASFHTL